MLFFVLFVLAKAHCIRMVLKMCHMQVKSHHSGLTTKHCCYLIGKAHMPLGEQETMLGLKC